MALFGKRSESRALATAETRDPNAATKNLQYLTPGRATPPNWDAGEAFERAYYANIVIFACVRLLANTIASLPFRTGADPDKPHDYDATSPLAALLGPPPGGPTNTLSARRLWAWTIAQREVTGRCGWEIETSPGTTTPIALWPLASSYLMPVPSQGGANWFAKFTYGRFTDQRTLDLDHIVYDWDPSGTDFRQPESWLQAANLDIAVAIMQSKYDYAFLKNDARPPAIVVTEQFEDEDSFEAFKQQWNSTHGGYDNAGRMAFLEATGGTEGVKGAVDVTVLGISPKDAQAAQRHADAMERIAIASGTPWSLLDASGRTFSNAGQEWENYIRHKVMPKLADLQDMVNIQLAPRLGDQVGWFDTTSLGLVPMDRLDAMGVSTLYGAGLITKGEGRQPFGLPPVPDGDQFVSTPAAINPVTGAETPPQLALAAAAPADEVRRMHPYDDDDGTCSLCGKPAVHQAHGYFMPRAAPIEVRALPPAPPDREARRVKIVTSTSSTVRSLERQWERAMNRLFARQARSAVARLEGKRGRALATRDSRAAADEVFDPAHWLDETVDALDDLYEATTAAGGARVSQDFGLAFDIEAPYAQDFIRAQVNRLAGQVTDTTYDAVKEAMAAGVAEGESIPELAARIKGVFTEASSYRSTLIARTEVIGAYNGSATLTAQQYGSDIVAGKEWIATMDSRTREEHAALDGSIVGMDQAFGNGLDYPGEPNCRCTVAFLTPDEMGATGRSRMVELRLACAVIRLVQPGHDEHTIRQALRVAA